MKIFGSVTSPYTRKVRLVALEKKIEYEFVIDHNLLTNYQAANLNPLGKVPVLQVDDSIVVFDSAVIAEYLDNLTPNKKLIPTSSREKMVVKRWEATCDGICDAVVAIFMEEQRNKEFKDLNLIARQQEKVDKGLAFCSKELLDNEYCFNNRLTLADIALICMLDYVSLRMANVDWQVKYSNLAKFSKRMLARPTVVTTAPPYN